MCDPIDERHKSILPEHVWGDGDPEGVRRRTAQEMVASAAAARRFFDAAPAAVKARLDVSGRTVVNGFTGSSIWHQAYAFPPIPPGGIEAGFADFAARWRPILDAFDDRNVYFAPEVHPTEIAFDIATAHRALEAIGGQGIDGMRRPASLAGYREVPITITSSRAHKEKKADL